MTQKPDGGPAYPNDWALEDGMTLRDYAAIHDEGLHEDASATYAAHFNRDPQPETGDMLGWAKWFAKADANLRYLRADAMIAARDAK